MHSSLSLVKIFLVTLYEQLELKNYPFDIQKLNITVISGHPTTECTLVRDPDNVNDILTEHFRDSSRMVFISLYWY